MITPNIINDTTKYILILINYYYCHYHYYPITIKNNNKKWSEKYSTFECCINTESDPRKPFSLRFFLLIILFIIFDIEIALILVIPILTSWSTQIALFMTMFIICKAPIKSPPKTNQRPAFYRPDAHPVAQPTVSKHWREIEAEN